MPSQHEDQPEQQDAPRPAVRDEAAVRRFVENMALFLADWGFPRMAARVLMMLMAAPEERLTAGELADRLGVSAAAISGAVRYLQQIGLAARTAVPGSRSDAYEMPENSWYAAAIVKGGLYKHLADLSEQAVQASGGEHGEGAGVRRLAEMRDFFLFLDVGVGRLLDEWNAERGNRT